MENYKQKPMVTAAYNEFKNKMAAALERKRKRKQKSKIVFSGKPIRSSRRAIIKSLDAIFSVYIRLRDKRFYSGLCLVCKARPIEHCFHFLSRGNYGTRWNEFNACGSCRGCNLNEYMDRTERNKDKFRARHVEIIGPEKREWLEQEARRVVRFSDADLLVLRNTFKKKLEGVNRG